MESLARRAALVCAALVFMAVSSPVEAQESPQQSSQGVPPAPPPGYQDSSQPASTASPRHRWVETDGYLTPQARRKGPVAKARSHKAKPSASRSKKAARAGKSPGKSPGKSKSHDTKALTKAELRHCKSLSHRQLQRNSKCKAALQAKPKSSKAKSKSSAHKERPAKTLSKAQSRRCRNMSYQQLLRNGDCAALLQRELESSKRSGHGAKAHKASERSKKAKPVRGKKPAKTTKRHRS